ncbi:MAG: hypothetical protein LBT11_03200 [Treponema sp.]|jgi:uncharacterized coiled-coil DUF342 family protein|nr:hypothetical protein [Treponema sp.]
MMEVSAQKTDQSVPVPPDADMVFDAASGFSTEEQQEILAKIEAAASAGRIIPVPEEADGEIRRAAKKRGGVFPLLVNLGALLVLAAGLSALFLFQSQEDGDIRGSATDLGVTERALIREIREETGRQLRAKDEEIGAIQSRLNEAEVEYRGLQTRELSEAETRRRDELEAQIAAYRRNLSTLNNERLHILEDSEQREAQARARPESEASNPGPDPLAGFLAADTAADTGEIEALQARIAGLEQQVQDQEQRLAAYSAEGSELSDRIEAYEDTIAGLRRTITAQDNAATEQGRQITSLNSTVSSLRSDNQRLNQTITDQNSRITTLTGERDSQAAEITRLNTQINAIRGALDGGQQSAAE